MRVSDPSLRPVLAVAVGAFILGVAAPAAAGDVARAIDGKSIAVHSTPGNRLRNHTLTSRQIKRHAITGDRLKPDSVTGAQVRESTLGTVPLAGEALTLPPLVWHPVDFVNGWHDIHDFPGYRDVAYAVDAQGIVHLRGDLEGGTAATAFTLPAGVNPATTVVIPIEAHYGVAQLAVAPDGDVSFGQQPGSGWPDPAVTSFVSLEGVTFSS